MLVLISPAKKLDFDNASATERYSQPRFAEKTQELVHQLRKMPKAEIKALMKLSDRLTDLNIQRYQDWSWPFTLENAKQALFAFRGDVYSQLNADTFSAKQIDFAQQSLRIISGLYGFLRPLDLIQAYRLEMGVPLKNKHGHNLYRYWGDTITNAVNTDLRETKKNTVINLASVEYFKAIAKDKLEGELITVHFKEHVANNQYKTIGLFSKRARGLMSRYIIEQEILNKEEIKQFHWEGYKYCSALSSQYDWVFTR